MQGWVGRLIGRDDRGAGRLKALLDPYPPYRIPFPGPGHALTLDQATANLDYLVAHKPERLAAIRTLLASFAIDLDTALKTPDTDPTAVLDAIWQWTASEWPAIADPALATPARYFASRRDGPEIAVSLSQDVALALGEIVLVRRSDYRWALDLDPANKGQTEADGMRSWQRPVLLRPADAIVPAIQLDLEDIVRTSYLSCAKPGYRFQRDMVQSVLDAISGAHERFWRDQAAHPGQR